MVVGNGMIAKKFAGYADDDNFIIFASGVSNSKSSDQNEYLREFTLLKETIAACSDRTLVYFSTASIYDPSEGGSDYINHKKHVEQYIESNVKKYVILRVSNVVGKSTNPNTIFNYLIRHIIEKTNFGLWLNASRNLIDIDDLFKVVDHLLQNKLFLNTIVNVANPKNYRIKEMVEAIELCYGKKASYIPIFKGCDFAIDISAIRPVFESLKIDFGDDYLKKLLLKYHS